MQSSYVNNLAGRGELKIEVSSVWLWLWSIKDENQRCGGECGDFDKGIDLSPLLCRYHHLDVNQLGNQRKIRQSNRCWFCTCLLDNSFYQSKWSGVSGLVWTENMASMICIRIFRVLVGPLMIHMDFTGCLYWRIVRCHAIDGRTDGFVKVEQYSA